MQTKDQIGREIKPGCEILYAVRRGSELWHERMRVQQIGTRTRMKKQTGGDGKTVSLPVEVTCISGYSPEGRRVNVYNTENVVVIVPLGTQYETAV